MLKTIGFFAKFLAIMAAVWLPFAVLFVSVSLPALLVGFVYWVGTGLGPVAWLAGLCYPIALGLAVMLASDWVAKEKALLDRVGPRAALWASFDEDKLPSNANVSWAKWPVRLTVSAGYDYARGILPPTLRALLDLEAVDDGLRDVGSALWARLVNTLYDAGVGRVPLWSLAAVGLATSVFYVGKGFTPAWRFVRFYWVMTAVVVCLPPEILGKGLWGVMTFVWRVGARGWAGENSVSEWLHWRLLHAVVLFTAWVESLNSEVRRRHSLKISAGSTRLVAHFRVFTIQFVQFVNDVQLPHFIRNRFQYGPTKQALDESLALMGKIGWPINVATVPASQAEPPSSSFLEWVLCGSDFKTGIHNLKRFVDEDLETLRIAGIYYKRTEEYQNVNNEEISLSRYFKSPKYDMPGLEADDVWELVGDIFRHSRLTPFNYIIKMWEKKYALGAFMRDPTRNRKYKRSTFISDLGGYAPFKALWARTFHYASLIWPVSHVSPKAEALPERKWAMDKIRTIVGSPISQYILSTIWNYGPNHRFAWESTPIKIGMPLNGYWMSRVWSRHARCQIHVEGDFTSFDSTVSGAIIDVIKAVRKKGYEHHKDRLAIADLIDVNYDQVSGQLLNTTSTGVVYRKGTGLTTGHSATSMDNSLALVTLYLMAWKELTGLSAREFLHFNELSCFGDDHFLSICQVRPLAWSPSNIRKVMAKWGVINNIEVKPLDKVEFLSKHWRVATPSDLLHLAASGVKGFRSIVWHDKDKLVGKLTAPKAVTNPTYRVKRLLSYLTLTAHHPDLYEAIVKVILRSRNMFAILKHDKLTLPSYRSVMQSWYSSKTTSQAASVIDEEVGETSKEGAFIEYGSVTLGDEVLNLLSMVPDLLNPVMFNYGYTNVLQLRLRRLVSWAIDLVSLQNNASTTGLLRHYLSRSPYRVLDPTLFVAGSSGANMTELLIRHWLFCFYVTLRPKNVSMALLNFFISRVSSLQFLLNGRMLSESRQSEVQFDLVLVIALLGLISGLPDWLAPLGLLTLPDLSVFFDMATHWFLVSLWSTVPANYKEVAAVVEHMGARTGPVLVEAATGTGKSTSLVAFLFQAFGHKYQRFVVIEPRSILVHGLVPYMKSSYALPVSGATTGVQIDKTARIFYVTPQALLGNLDLLTKGTLLILDESHLEEQFYSFLRKLFREHKVPYLMTTATPSPENIGDSGVHVRLDAASLFTRVEEKVDRSKAPCAMVDQSPKACLNDYKSYVLDFVKALSPSAKVLVCVPTVSMVDECVSRAAKPSLGLSSKHAIPSEWSSQVYFATPVTDVGLTIPGLSHVITSDIVMDGEGSFCRLSPASLSQRFGRVGRTSNGVAILVRYGLQLPFPMAYDNLTEKDYAQMIFSGLPPEVALSFDRRSAASSIGLNPDSIPEEKWDGVIRAASVFYANLRPIFASHVAAASAQQSVYGTPVVLQGTGAGNLSSSWPTNPEQLAKDASSLFGAIVRSNLEGVPLGPSVFSDNALVQAAGPILAIKGLANRLAASLETGMSKVLNIRNNPNSPTQLQELVKIGELLASLC